MQRCAPVAVSPLMAVCSRLPWTCLRLGSGPSFSPTQCLATLATKSTKPAYY